MLAENKCGGSVFHEELCAIGTAKKRKEKKNFVEKEKLKKKKYEKFEKRVEKLRKRVPKYCLLK